MNVEEGALKIVVTLIKEVASEDTGHGWLHLLVCPPASDNFEYTH